MKTMIDPYEKEMMDLYNRTVNRGEGTYDRGVVCPSSYDVPGEAKHPCKLCEMCKEVLFKGLSKEDPLRKRASALNQKQKYFSNIIMAANPAEIIVLEYGKKMFDQILAGQMGDSEWKNFMHPTEGRNLFITKIQGMTREQVDYKVDPRFTPSPLPAETMKLIRAGKLVNLSDIIALLDAGQVKPVYQSKLFRNMPSGVAPKVEIRILPSWLGPHTTKFFQLVFYHQISQEDFDLVQAGKLNPIQMTAKPVEQAYDVKTYDEPDTTGNSTWAAFKGDGSDEIEMDDDIDDDPRPAPAPIKRAAPPKPLPPPEPEEVEEEEKLCFGNYDETDPKCAQCVDEGWGDGCRIAYNAKLAKRKAARRLAR